MELNIRLEPTGGQDLYKTIWCNHQSSSSSSTTCIICKRRSFASKPKIDVNPVYGEDGQNDQNKEDYDYMG